MNATRVVVKLRINLAGEHEGMQSMERGLSLYGDANFGPGSRALHIRLADLISVAGTPNDERIRRFQVALLSYNDIYRPKGKPFFWNFTYRSHSSLED